MSITDIDSSKTTDPIDMTESSEMLSHKIQDCCVTTIEKLVINNPMMVCPDCKQLIKCYRDEKQFLNYIKFCESRKRPIVTGKVSDFYTVIFNSYS